MGLREDILFLGRAAEMEFFCGRVIVVFLVRVVIVWDILCATPVTLSPAGWRGGNSNSTCTGC